MLRSNRLLRSNGLLGLLILRLLIRILSIGRTILLGIRIGIICAVCRVDGFAYRETYDHASKQHNKRNHGKYAENHYNRSYTEDHTHRLQYTADDIAFCKRKHAAYYTENAADKI